MVLFLKYRVFTFGFMGVSDLNLYKILRTRLGDQESHDLVEFIHSEVKAEMETVKTNLDTKTNIFLTKEDKIDLIDRMDITKSDLMDRMDTIKSDLIDRMDTIKSDLIDRINKVKTDMIVWIVGVSLLQYILLMVTRKFF